MRKETESVSQPPENAYLAVSRFHELKRRSTSLLTGGLLRLSRLTTGEKESIERREAGTMTGLQETDLFLFMT